MKGKVPAQFKAKAKGKDGGKGKAEKPLPPWLKKSK